MFSRIKSSAGSIKTKDMIEYILLFIGAVIMFYKSFMGINIGDEVFYLELMHRFAQGDCPFLHEWHPTQIYAIMLYPLYVLYVFLKGSNNGIILAGRLLMNSITFLTALIIYGILKRGGYFNFRTSYDYDFTVVLFLQWYIGAVILYGCV